MEDYLICPACGNKVEHSTKYCPFCETLQIGFTDYVDDNINTFVSKRGAESPHSDASIIEDNLQIFSEERRMRFEPKEKEEVERKKAGPYPKKD